MQIVLSWKRKTEAGLVPQKVTAVKRSVEKR
jgi:hypothetical protein